LSLARLRAVIVLEDCDRKMPSRSKSPHHNKHAKSKQDDAGETGQEDEMIATASIPSMLSSQESKGHSQPTNADNTRSAQFIKARRDEQFAIKLESLLNNITVPITTTAPQPLLVANPPSLGDTTTSQLTSVASPSGSTGTATRWRWYDSKGEGPITRFLRADDPTVALPTTRVAIMLLLGFLLSASVIWLSEDEFFEGTTDRKQSQQIFDFPVHVAFQGVGCSISGMNEPVLHDLTGSIPPGKLTGVLGQSGSGKTLFSYQLLGKGRKFCSQANTGQVYLNGRPRSLEAFLDRVGFVPQDDVLYGDLTVDESIQFSANWRLPRSLSESEKMEIVNETISILNLNRVRSSKIGTVRNRGISGGERRRVSIGMELVARPSVLIAVSFQPLRGPLKS